MRSAMTSPSFDVVAKVPSPPRHGQTRATDSNQPIRSEAVRVTRERDEARTAAIEARLEQIAPTTSDAGIHCSITTDLLHLDGENIAALPLIERRESLRGLMAIEVPGLRFSDYVIGGGPRFREHTWRLGFEGSARELRRLVGARLRGF
jgi:hypothetical protein